MKTLTLVKPIEFIYFAALETLPIEDISHNGFSSDLYIRVTDKSRILIEQYKYKNLVSTFIDNIDHVLWYDIPFAFPYRIFDNDKDNKGTRTWYFKGYDEHGNHIYDNNIPNVGYCSNFYKEIVVTKEDLKKYKIIF